MLSNPFNWQWIWVRGPKRVTMDRRVDEAEREASKLCMKYCWAVLPFSDGPTSERSDRQSESYPGVQLNT